MQEVVLDTNFCLVPFQFRIDIFEAIPALFDEPILLVVPKFCVDELHKIKKRAAIKLLAEKNVFIKDIGKGDKAIMDYAIKRGAIVATNDAYIRKTLKREDLKVISLKSKKKVAFV